MFFQNLPLKDFSSEIRANLDMKMFIKEAALLLDLQASSIDEIIHEMLQAVFGDPANAAHNNNNNHSNHTSVFLSPAHSPRDSTTEEGIPNHSNNHSRHHTLTRESGVGLFASVAAKQMSPLCREELIEEAKKALLLEIHHEDQACKLPIIPLFALWDSKVRELNLVTPLLIQ